MTKVRAEQAVGIELFFTSAPGIGGKCRTIPEDFSVREMFQHPPPQENGIYTIAEVTATNWDTNLLIRELSHKLRMSRMRVGFAGTKDKRSHSTRLMSFYNVPIEALSKLRVKDVVIEHMYTSNQPIKIGDLVGNTFDVVIRNIDDKQATKHIRDTTSCIVDHGGFPNFYGMQRFGVVRPINHLIGKNIVMRDFQRAVMTYIAHPIKGEDKDTYEIRKRLQQSYDFPEALASYSNKCSFEKAILNRLVVDSKDFIGAFQELPKNLLTMFVYAYQSYLFNRILSERIRRKLPLNKALIGDIVLPVRGNSIDENGIVVTDSNHGKVNKQVAKGKAFVSGLLAGSDVLFSDGEMGEIEHEIILAEKFDLRDFTIPEIPYLSSSGSRRPLLADIHHIEWAVDNDEMNSGKTKTRLQFELRKGCYATALLREVMKSEDVKNY